MHDAVIINDLTPRIGADYGLASQIRSAGAYRIATALHNAGYRTQVIDYFFYLNWIDQKAILDCVLSDKTKIVGFSDTNLRGHTKDSSQRLLIVTKDKTERRTDGLFHFWEIARKIIQYIKETFPHIKIVYGGGQVTDTQDLGVEYMRNKIDYVFTGDADISIVKLLDHLTKDTPLTYYSQWKLNGETHDFDNTKIIHSNLDYTVDNEYIANQIDINHPAVGSLLESNEYVSLEASRGCIFNCYFCSYRRGNKRRNVESIRQEIIRNYEHYGVTRFRFMDDTFNDNYEKVKNITDMLKSLPFDVEWHTYTRTDLFWRFPDMIDMMYDAGCRYIKFGLESTNDAALQACNKKLSHAKAAHVLEEVDKRTNGRLHSHSSFIIGLPLETTESMKHTFDYIKSSPLATVSFTTFFRDKYVEDEGYRMMSEFGKDTQMHGLTGFWSNWSHDTMNMKQALELYNYALNFYKPERPFFIGSDMYPILRGFNIKHDDVFQYYKESMTADNTVQERHTKWLSDHIERYKQRLFASLNITYKPGIYLPENDYSNKLQDRMC